MTNIDSGSKKQRGEDAFAVHNKIIENEDLRRQLLLENAAFLSEMQENEYYKDILGEEDGTWRAYLGQIEVFYSRNKVYDLQRIYKKYLCELSLPYQDIETIPHSRLIVALSIVTLENVQSILSMAKTLTAHDFDTEMRKLKGLATDEDKHAHDFSEFKACNKCGHKEKLEHGT